MDRIMFIISLLENMVYEYYYNDYDDIINGTRLILQDSLIPGLPSPWIYYNPDTIFGTVQENLFY